MLASRETPLVRRHQLQVAQVALPQSAELRKVPTVSTLARPAFFRSPCIGGQNLSLEPIPSCLQWFMPILKGTGDTLLCSRFAYRKRISTPAKSVNSENTGTLFLSATLCWPLLSAVRFQRFSVSPIGLWSVVRGRTSAFHFPLSTFPASAQHCAT